MSSTDVLKNLRKEYGNKNTTFTEDSLVSKDPIVQFKKWLDEAIEAPGIHEANAMCLATANRNGMPSARYVLLKGCGPQGFEFYTNYNSRKGRDLEENPQAAITFYWPPLSRSVRIEGRVVKVDPGQCTQYFNSRPKESQISAYISKQSSVVANRQHMEKEIEKFKQQIGEEIVKKPDHWGGYSVIPDSIEFWQGQTSRLHDRIKFRKLKSNEVIDNTITHMAIDGWVYERLYP